jgi:hypothetical protein
LRENRRGRRDGRESEKSRTGEQSETLGHDNLHYRLMLRRRTAGDAGIDGVVSPSYGGFARGFQVRPHGCVNASPAHDPEKRILVFE